MPIDKIKKITCRTKEEEGPTGKRTIESCKAVTENGLKETKASQRIDIRGADLVEYRWKDNEIVANYFEGDGECSVNYGILTCRKESSD